MTAIGDIARIRDVLDRAACDPDVFNDSLIFSFDVGWTLVSALEQAKLDQQRLQSKLSRVRETASRASRCDGGYADGWEEAMAEVREALSEETIPEPPDIPHVTRIVAGERPSDYWLRHARALDSVMEDDSENEPPDFATTDADGF